MNSGWEDSTVSTYTRSLRVDVHGAETEVGLELLPVDSTERLILLFTTMDGMSWTRIRLNKQAVRAWHVSRGMVSIFDSAWDERAAHFWRGLKKRANHDSYRKRGVSVEEVFDLAKARLAVGSPAGLRDAAMAMVAFFGVRRVSEVLQFWRSEVVVTEACISLWIRRQKNDTAGVGQWCWIPRYEGIDNIVSTAVISEWVKWWDTTYPGQHDNAEPLFCVTTGQALATRSPKSVSADSGRKTLPSYSS